MTTKDTTLDNLAVDLEPEVDHETALAVNPAVGWSANPEFEQGDLFISKLRLAQGLTPEVQEGKAKPGDWVLTACPPMKAPRVIPLLYAKKTRKVGVVGGTNRYIMCNDHGDHDPEDVCPNCYQRLDEALVKAKEYDTTTEAYYQYIVYVLDYHQPAILEFARTGIRTGKMLNAMAATRGLGNFAVQLGSAGVQNGNKVYNVPQVSLAEVTQEELTEAQGFVPRG